VTWIPMKEGSESDEAKGRGVHINSYKPQ